MAISKEEKFIERRIAIGFLISDDFVREIEPLYKSKYIIAEEARIIIGWCCDYFQEYNIAPKHEIQAIYMDHISELEKDQAEFIEDILDSISDEIERDSFNLDYLLKQTKTYFKQRKLEIYLEEIKGDIARGKIDRAEFKAEQFKTIEIEENRGMIPFDDPEKVYQAFEDDADPLIRMGGDLGKRIDSSLVRDSFVALLGRSKAGKTWWLSEFMKRAVRSGRNVVMFQAGDMGEKQQLRRLAIGLAGRSNRAKYCGPMYIPVLDCFYNQTDECDLKIRDCDHGPFDGFEQKQIDPLSMGAYINAYKRYPDYIPCTSCKHERRSKLKGAIWYKYQRKVKPLTWKDAFRYGEKFNKRYGKRWRVFTYPNKGLTLSIIRRKLDSLDRNGFVADIVIIDYMELLRKDPWMSSDFRHGQNEIWASTRGLSSERNCLIIGGSQSDANSFDIQTLASKNFSEDKRKLDHVTAMYGLNTTDFERSKGIQRINAIVLREDAVQTANQTVILQCLQQGRPYLDSFQRIFTK